MSATASSSRTPGVWSVGAQGRGPGMVDEDVAPVAAEVDDEPRHLRHPRRPAPPAPAPDVPVPRGMGEDDAPSVGDVEDVGALAARVGARVGCRQGRAPGAPRRAAGVEGPSQGRRAWGARRGLRVARA